MLKRFNLIFTFVPILIFSLSSITLFSVGNELFKQHLLYFVVGIVMYFIVSFIDIDVAKYFWKYIYAAVFFMLLLTDILGSIKLGAARWLVIAGISIQPSEFAKIAIILCLSAFLSLNSERISRLQVLMKFLFLTFVFAAFVAAQPDLGTAIITVLIAVGISFVAGIDKKYIFLVIMLLGILSFPVWNSLYDYQKTRILVFLDPTIDTLGAGYNVLQSMIAIGSGGLFGKGLGNGTQAALNYLPIYWTDFIFATFAEEWGFIGVTVLLVLYTVLLVGIIHLVYTTQSMYLSLVCTGIFCVFFSQFVINVGMNLGLLPVTGIPLPLMSYGGSSLVSSFTLLGMLNSIWIHQTKSY